MTQGCILAGLGSAVYNKHTKSFEALNSHTLIDDSDFLQHDTLLIAAASAEDYSTKKTNFFDQFGLFLKLILVFYK